MNTPPPRRQVAGVLGAAERGGGDGGTPSDVCVFVCLCARVFVRCVWCVNLCNPQRRQMAGVLGAAERSGRDGGAPLERLTLSVTSVLPANPRRGFLPVDLSVYLSISMEMLISFYLCVYLSIYI